MINADIYRLVILAKPKVLFDSCVFYNNDQNQQIVCVSMFMIKNNLWLNTTQSSVNVPDNCLLSLIYFMMHSSCAVVMVLTYTYDHIG